MKTNIACIIISGLVAMFTSAMNLHEYAKIYLLMIIVFINMGAFKLK